MILFSMRLKVLARHAAVRYRNISMCHNRLNRFVLANDSVQDGKVTELVNVNRKTPKDRVLLFSFKINWKSSCFLDIFFSTENWETPKKSGKVIISMTS